MIKKLLLAFVFLFAFSCSSSIEDSRLMDANKMSQLISKKDKTLVYIWTTWCSGCRETLAETLPDLKANIDTSEVQIILIAASKNKHEVDSLVGKSGFTKSSYFLDFIGPDKGKFQTLGIKQFLSANFKGEKIYTGGIPVFFLVDRNGKVLNKKLPHSCEELISDLK